MTPSLQERYCQDLQLASVSPRTVEAYTGAVDKLGRHFAKTPDAVTEEELREFFLHRWTVEGVSRSSATISLCAIKYFWQKTLARSSRASTCDRAPRGAVGTGRRRRRTSGLATLAAKLPFGRPRQSPDSSYPNPYRYREVTVTNEQLSAHQIAMALLGVAQGDDTAGRERALCHLVLDLLQEVHALRLLAIRTHPREFAEAYETSAVLAHNGAGMTTGVEKLVLQYRGDSPSRPRELLFLEELGYSPAELERVADVFEQAQALT